METKDQNHHKEFFQAGQPSGEQSSPPVPKTAKQLAAKGNQERIKSILPLAYLLKCGYFFPLRILTVANKIELASGDIGVSTAEMMLFSRWNGDDLEEYGFRVAGGSVDCQTKEVTLQEMKILQGHRRRPYGDLESNAQTTESSSQALVAQDGLGGYD
ncbi:hypothetical protein Tco_1465669 [Tanacetum coccineum]|uniref:Uncharacterized protein n=1 Tax=Tanacetum coccineum TaxID=301880 RepID=A0ABQ5AI83_9ASTR